MAAMTSIVTGRRANAPVCDQIEAVAKDVLLTTAAKRNRISTLRGEGCLAALHAAGLPLTVRQQTKRGEVALTVQSARHLRRDGADLKNAVRVRVAVTLGGTPAKVDPDRIFVNPPMQMIAEDGENETTVVEIDATGKEQSRTERWREAPAEILLRELMRQVMAELEAA